MSVDLAIAGLGLSPDSLGAEARRLGAAGDWQAHDASWGSIVTTGAWRAEGGLLVAGHPLEGPWGVPDHTTGRPDLGEAFSTWGEAFVHAVSGPWAAIALAEAAATSGLSGAMPISADGALLMVGSWGAKRRWTTEPGRWTKGDSTVWMASPDAPSPESLPNFRWAGFVDDVRTAVGGLVDGPVHQADPLHPGLALFRSRKGSGMVLMPVPTRGRDVFARVLRARQELFPSWAAAAHREGTGPIFAPVFEAPGLDVLRQAARP